MLFVRYGGSAAVKVIDAATPVLAEGNTQLHGDCFSVGGTEVHAWQRLNAYKRVADKSNNSYHAFAGLPVQQGDLQFENLPNRDGREACQ